MRSKLATVLLAAVLLWVVWGLPGWWASLPMWLLLCAGLVLLLISVITDL